MVNGWFGFLGSPHERDCYFRGIPIRIPNHWAPNQRINPKNFPRIPKNGRVNGLFHGLLRTSRVSEMVDVFFPLPQRRRHQTFLISGGYDSFGSLDNCGFFSRNEQIAVGMSRKNRLEEPTHNNGADCCSYIS